MNPRLASRRAGLAVGDLLIVLSLLGLVLAMVWPSIRRAAYRARVASVASGVEAVTTSARSHLERQGDWPEGSPPGSIPAELLPSLPADFEPATAHYSVSWHVWERVGILPQAAAGGEPGVGAPVESAEGAETPTPTLGLLAGITVRSDDEALLAGLLQRYGEELSFVSGRSWTLIMADGAPDPG